MFQVRTTDGFICPIRELIEVEENNAVGVDGHHACDDAKDVQHETNLQNIDSSQYLVQKDVI